MQEARGPKPGKLGKIARMPAVVQERSPLVWFHAQLEVPILLATLVLAVLGVGSALASRLLWVSRHGRIAMGLFLTTMGLVVGTTMMALSIGSSCWITGSGSLLLMSLIGTVAPRPQATPLV